MTGFADDWLLTVTAGEAVGDGMNHARDWRSLFKIEPINIFFKPSVFYSTAGPSAARQAERI